MLLGKREQQIFRNEGSSFLWTRPNIVHPLKNTVLHTQLGQLLQRVHKILECLLASGHQSKIQSCTWESENKDHKTSASEAATATPPLSQLSRRTGTASPPPSPHSPPPLQQNHRAPPPRRRESSRTFSNHHRRQNPRSNARGDREAAARPPGLGRARWRGQGLGFGS